MQRGSGRANGGLSIGAITISVVVHLGLVGALIGLASDGDVGRSTGAVAGIEIPRPAASNRPDADPELELLEPSVLEETPLDARLEPEEAPAPAPELESAVEPSPPVVDVPPTDRFAPLPSAGLGGPPMEDDVEQDDEAADVVQDDAHQDRTSEEVVESEDLVAVDEAADEPDEPQLLEAAPPAYPRLARRRGWEGSVLLDLRVAADGTVAEAVVVTSSGHPVLDEAALGAVRGWLFVAGAADRSVRHQVTFDLR